VVRGNPSRPRLGQTYSGYQFNDVVDSSHSGVVYRVRNLAENRFKHLRVLAKAMREDHERGERFFLEAKVWARLTHRGILSFSDATRLEEQFVVMPEVTAGATLADCLDFGPLPVPAELDTVVLKALAKNPSCRFQSAVNFREALLVPVMLPASDQPEGSREVDPLFAAPASVREAASMHVAMLTPAEPEAMATNREAAGVTQPERSLPEVNIEARQLTLLSLGFVAMVTKVMLVTR